MQAFTSLNFYHFSLSHFMTYISFKDIFHKQNPLITRFSATPDHLFLFSTALATVYCVVSFLEATNFRT